MDWLSSTGEFGLQDDSTPAPLTGLNGASMNGTFNLSVYSAPDIVSGQSLTDTLEIKCRTTFTAWVEGPGFTTAGTSFEVESDVICDPDNGHMTVVSTNLTGPAGEEAPSSRLQFDYDGETYVIVLFGVVTQLGGENLLTLKAFGSAKLTEISSLVSIELPDNDFLLVENEFKSKEK